MMWEHIEETIGKGNYHAEALFYCSDNNYEYIKARDAYMKDLEFERKTKKDKDTKRRSSRKKR